MVALHFIHYNLKASKPGAVAQSEASSLGMQAALLRSPRLAHSSVETWS